MQFPGDVALEDVVDLDAGMPVPRDAVGLVVLQKPESLPDVGLRAAAGRAIASAGTCAIIRGNEIASASTDRIGVGEGECSADGRAVGYGHCRGDGVFLHSAGLSPAGTWGFMSK